MKRSIAESVPDRVSVHTRTGGGALPHKAIQDVKFFRVSFVSINSWMGYENWSEIPKQVMTIQFKNNNLLFSRKIDDCFPIDFGFFCDLTIPKQGIGMQIFPKRVVGILKKWALPHQVTFKWPLPRALESLLSKQFLLLNSTALLHSAVESGTFHIGKNLSGTAWI